MIIAILNKIKAGPSLNIDFYELEVSSEKMYHRQISLDNSVPEALTWEDLEIHEDQENFVELDNALSAIKIYEWFNDLKYNHHHRNTKYYIWGWPIGRQKKICLYHSIAKTGVFMWSD